MPGTDPGAAPFVEHFAGALATAGFPLQPARVFAALLASDAGRLTSAELAAGLEISPSAVSGAVAYLAQIGLLRKERERGSRRDVYVVTDDAWHDMMLNKDKLYGPIIAALAQGLPHLSEQPRAHARISVSLEFLEFVKKEMDGIIERWEQHRASAASAPSTEGAGPPFAVPD